jgi:hydrogenase-4 component F
MLITFLIFCPIVASILLLSARRIAIFETICLLSAALEWLAGMFVAGAVLQFGSYSSNAYFSLDSLSALILLTTLTVGLFASFYSIGYLRAEFAKQIIGLSRVKQFFILLELFIGTMVLAITTSNPIIMWTAIEATTLATVFLISFYNKPSSTEAAWKYLIINSIGLLIGFFGTILYFTAFGSDHPEIATWQSLLTNASHLNPLIAKIAFIFTFIGFGTKVGLAPMHTWLPDAHSKAPAPISALLSGALLNVALLSIIRFKILTDASIGPSFTRSVMMFFGAASLFIAAFIILTQKNYKRLMAYSSIEHMGVAVMGFGFGGLGIFFALLHLIYHSLSKSLLFFTAGNLFLKFSTTKIIKVKGILSVLPVSGVILLVGFLAITGVPPFGIFITEWNILSAGIVNHPIYAFILLTCLTLTFAGFFRHIVGMIFGQAPDEVAKGESNSWTLVSPVILAGLLLGLSFYLPAPLRTLITNAAGIIK